MILIFRSTYLCLQKGMKYKMKKVTLIIPVYNSEKYIGKCLDSILNQTYTNFEI